MDDDVVIEESTEDGDEGTAEQKLKKLRDQLKEIKNESANNLAGWQRAKADYVNLSQRMRGMGEEMTRSAIRGLAEAFIPVADTLEAAAGHDQGLGGALKQMDEAFKSAGITRYTPAAGEAFDPARHESVQVLATENEKDDNTISKTLQSGYALDSVIIRPARVIINHHG